MLVQQPEADQGPGQKSKKKGKAVEKHAVMYFLPRELQAEAGLD